MDVTISGRHVAVTDAMREHARERAQKLEHFSPHLMRVQVTLTIEGARHEAECTGTFRAKDAAVGKSTSHDMYKSIDEAVAKVERQLKKMEDRFEERRRGARQKRSEVPGAPEVSPDGEDDEA